MSIRVLTCVLALAAVAGMARAQEPLSAIDWLSDSVTGPAPQVTPMPGTSDGSDTVEPPEVISVTPLDQPKLDAVGVIPPAVAGLPANLWGPSQPAELARLILAEDTLDLPTLHRLFYRLLLTELDPPVGAADDGTLFLARLDKLLDLGALEQAQALLEQAGPTDPALFRRWFDVSLLTGHEDRACAAMRAAPGIAPTFPARIFCLARGGDWNAAILALETGKALGYVSEAEDALLIRFLDPEFADISEPLDLPQRPSPLVFRMYEAIGMPIATTGLPVAFAQADLRSTTGWKAQIEAAERLARSGAISPNALLGIYSMRAPAASGGLWDRVDALQKFDVALLSGKVDAVTDTLPRAWAAMQAVRLEGAFAELYAARLGRLPLTGEAARLALKIGLLSPDYEAIALALDPAEADDLALLAALARGLPAAAEPSDRMAAAVAAAFAETAPPLPHALEQAVLDGRLGEAVLKAIHLICEGATGDLDDVTTGLVLLRRIGLEEPMRRTALDLTILDRRG